MNRLAVSARRRPLAHAGGLLASMLLLSSACSAPEGDAITGQAAEALVTSDPTVPLAISLPPPVDPQPLDHAVPASAPTQGMWSNAYSWPINGLHSILLPTGQVLTFGTPTNQPDVQDGRYFDVWTPASGLAPSAHQTSFDTSRVNSFCGVASYLGDGRLFVAGGDSTTTQDQGAKESTLFIPTTGATSTDTNTMAWDRWYATMINLPDGRPVILGGSTPYGALQGFRDPAGTLSKVSLSPEVYDATGWHTLFGATSELAFGPDYNRYWYPRAWVTPAGEVFGISTEQMWYLNPSGNGAIRSAGTFKTGADMSQDNPNPATLPNVGPTSSAVMFAPGRILQVGGNGYNNADPVTDATWSSRVATVIDINGSSPVVTDTQPMTHARQWPNATVLPDGRVLVSGGTGYGNDYDHRVYEAELWNPADGTWTIGASASYERVYHSAAILLPDGTVLSTGGGAPGPVNLLKAEIYYPPYLFTTAGGVPALATRPVIQAVSALKANPGDTVEFDVATPPGRTVQKVVLIGTSSVTHSFNTSQRWSSLTFVTNAQRVAAALPATANLAPPGYYQLIAVDSAGVPSAGVIVAVGAMAAPPLPVAPPAPRLIQVNGPPGQQGLVAAWGAHGGLVNGGNPLELYTGSFASCPAGECSLLLAPIPGKANTYTIQVNGPGGTQGIIASWGAHSGLSNGGNPLQVYTGTYATCAPGDCDFIVTPIPGKPNTYTIQVNGPNGTQGLVASWGAHLGINNGANPLVVHTGTYATCAAGDCDFVITSLCPAATEPSGCALGAAQSGGTSGACPAGYTGSCSYTCSNGAWTQVADTCAPPATALPSRATIQVNGPDGAQGLIASWNAHGGLVSGGNPPDVYLGTYATCTHGDCDFSLTPIPGKANTFTIGVTGPGGQQGILAAWNAHNGLDNTNPLLVYTGGYATCAPGDCDFIVTPIPGKASTYMIQVNGLDGQQGVVAAWDAHSGLVNGGNGLAVYNGTYATCAPGDCDFVITALPTAVGTIQVDGPNNTQGIIASSGAHLGLSNGGNPLQVYTGTYATCAPGDCDLTFTPIPGKPNTYTIQVNGPNNTQGLIASWGAHGGLANGGNPLQVYTGTYATCAPGDCDFIVTPIPGKPNTYTIQVNGPNNTQGLIASWGAHSGLSNGGNPLQVYTGTYATCAPGDCDFIITWH